MTDGGKGSSPRPFSVDRKTYEDNWDRIFGKKEKLPVNDYQDILSTEECVLESLDRLDKGL